MGSINALLDRDDGRRSPIGRCVGFEDGLDGFVIHADKCRWRGKGWTHNNYDCVDYFTWKGYWPEWADNG